MALNGLFCADVPLRNYSLTHSQNLTYEDAIEMALDKALWGLLAASRATHWWCMPNNDDDVLLWSEELSVWCLAVWMCYSAEQVNKDIPNQVQVMTYKITELEKTSSVLTSAHIPKMQGNITSILYRVCYAEHFTRLRLLYAFYHYARPISVAKWNLAWITN